MGDVTWLGTKDYDSATGKGAIGVEFAGMAVTSTGFKGNMKSAQEEAATWAENEPLKWVEGYYRGYFELHLRQDEAETRYFGKTSIES